MTKGYILQDIETKNYILEIIRPWESPEYKLIPDISKATILSEIDVFLTLENISQDIKSECYNKKLIEITIWTT